MFMGVKLYYSYDEYILPREAVKLCALDAVHQTVDFELETWQCILLFLRINLVVKTELTFNTNYKKHVGPMVYCKKGFLTSGWHWL